MEGILKAETEVKELKVDEVEKHVDDSSSSSSSSDEDEAAPAEEFTRIESAVVVLNEKLSSSSSSSSSNEEGDDELIIYSTVHDPVEDSGVVAVLEAESIAAVEAYKEGVEEALEKVDESESSESDMKVLPIEEEEEEEAVVVAGSLETGDLVFNDSPPENVPAIESGSGSVVEDKVESPVLIPTMAQRVRSPTSWMSCCGLFQVLRRDC